jgi:hypothetical protein
MLAQAHAALRKTRVWMMDGEGCDDAGVRCAWMCEGGRGKREGEGQAGDGDDDTKVKATWDGGRG